MRRPQRLIAAALLVAFSGALGGCSSGFGGGFDPTDMLDWLDTKKKLPGERKPVFPEGVPGMEQGVPKELYKGARSSSSSRISPPAPGRRVASAAAAGAAARQQGVAEEAQQGKPAQAAAAVPADQADGEAAAAGEDATAGRSAGAASRRRSCASAPPRRRRISRSRPSRRSKRPASSAIPGAAAGRNVHPLVLRT